MNIPGMPPEGLRVLGLDRFSLAAVLVIRTPQGILFTRRAAGIPQGDEVCFPGGRWEPEEDPTPKHTALRETQEELGWTIPDPEALTYLGTQINPRGILVHAYSLEWPHALEHLKPDRREVAQVFFLPPEVLRTQHRVYPVELHIKAGDPAGDLNQELLPTGALDLPPFYRGPWKAGRLPVHCYLTAQGTIWGLTGEILYEYLKNCPLGV